MSMQGINLTDAHALAARNIGRDPRDVKLVQAINLKRNVVAVITEDTTAFGGNTVQTTRLTMFHDGRLLAQLIIDNRQL